MTVLELRPPGIPPNPWRPHAEVSWWGMVLFCVTEAALFAYFIASYFYLGVENQAWPPAGIERPALALPLVMTVLLVSSSVVLVGAERALSHGRRTRYRALVVLTVLLGAGFLALQLVEFHTKLAKTLPSEHAYASLFYLITGFHGCHVLGGLLLILWSLAAELSGRVNHTRPIGVKVTSLYWHFVDGVWLVILTSLYLSPRLY